MNSMSYLQVIDKWKSCLGEVTLVALAVLRRNARGWPLRDLYGQAWAGER